MDTSPLVLKKTKKTNIKTFSNGCFIDLSEGMEANKKESKNNRRFNLATAVW